MMLPYLGGKFYCNIKALLLALRWQATGFLTMLMSPPSQSPEICSAPKGYLLNQLPSLPLHFIHAPTPVGVCVCVCVLLLGDFRELVCHLCVWLFPFAFQLMLQQTVPMCSSQYERMFNTTRVPGVETGRVFSGAISSTVLLMIFSLGLFVHVF